MKKIDRKDFLKMSGGIVAGGLTGYVFSGAPFLGLQWLVEWTQDQHVPPGGAESYLKTVCEACGGNCDLAIRMIGDRAVKIETSNSGCPFGQNALQLLYHPERIDAPLKRTGKKGSARASSFEKVTWDEAISEIAKQIKKRIEEQKGNKIAGVSGNRNLSSALLDRLLKAAGSMSAYYEPSGAELERAVLGGSVEYDFSNCDYILSFGARLLEGWGVPSAMHRAFIGWRERGVKLVQADAVRTRTASIADIWLPIKPGTELYLALGIANALRRRGRTAGGPEWNAVVDQYSPEKVAALTGVVAKQIEDVAAAFATARNPVAVAGRGAKGVSSSSGEILAVYALNVAVGSRAAVRRGAPRLEGIGEPVLTPAAAASLKEAKRFNGFDEFIKNSSFEVMIVNECDPVYKSVYGAALASQLEKAFVVSISPLLNDTARYADYVLPSISFLESDTPSGPAPCKPYQKAIHAADAVLRIAQGVPDTMKNFPWGSYIDLIRAFRASAPAGGPAFDAKVLKECLARLDKELKPNEQFPLALIPVELPYVGDGDGLAFPYVLKTIDEKTFSQGRLWVQINRATAKREGISEGERIDIESPRGEVGSVRAHLTDTVPPDTIAIPLGFGHGVYTRYGEGKGVNPKEIMSDEIDPLTGTANWWFTRVKIS